MQHPIIDSDGHIVEILPVLSDYIREVAGADAVTTFERRVREISRLPLEVRRDVWLPRGPFWGVPSKNTLDRLTVGLPRLLRSRMDQLGMDFAVLFPTIGSTFLWGSGSVQFDLAGCRAYNRFVADQFRDCGDRMTPAAIIPMYTPADAIAELEQAASLGLKVALLSAFVRRPIGVVARTAPALAPYFTRLDAFGIDSEHDYDAVWKKCIELQLPVMMHGFALGFTDRSSPTNYVHNHMGHFSAAQETACRSLFMGGVTRRFPELRFGFLEGGVHWAARLVNDIAGRWSKRNVVALRENLDPALLDKQLARQLCAQYGGAGLQGRIEEVVESLGIVMAVDPADPTPLDEFVACGIEQLRDIERLFANFYFGCEADDPLVAVAFDPRANVFGSRLKALFGSDIGHWDVVDLTAPVAEAYELVEHEVLDPEEFRAFTCSNAIELYGGMNPDFFRGTVLENYVREHPPKPDAR
jgi:predicted TIM-barrel fold metal-dependent hydrolase